MKRLSIGIMSVAVCLVASTSLMAASGFDVYGAYAPNGFAAAPSWDLYVDNANGALESGSSSAGGDRATDPSAYMQISGTISPLDIFSTGFNSWNGAASPNPVFDGMAGVFQAELGNRVHFGVHIVVEGASDFSLQDLSWTLDSSDDTNFFDSSGDFSAANYSSTRVGIDYGPNGVKGGGDDIVYNDGEAGSMSIDELNYVGVGTGFAAVAADGVNPQDAINENLRDLLSTCADCDIDIVGTYTLANPGGGDPLVASSTVNVFVPAGMGGDYDYDRQITSRDADMMTTQVSSGGFDILYDLNSDALIDFDDLEILVREIANTWFGDANFDGVFNSGDVIQVLGAGLFDTGTFAVWSQGDFNADGEFNSGDLIRALADGGFGAGPKPALAAVPEPTSIVLTLIGLALVAVRSRRR